MKNTPALWHTLYDTAARFRDLAPWHPMLLLGIAPGNGMMVAQDMPPFPSSPSPLRKRIATYLSRVIVCVLAIFQPISITKEDCDGQ